MTIEIELSSNPKLISTLLGLQCSFYCFPHRVSRRLVTEDHPEHLKTHSYTGRERCSNWK